MVRSRNSGKSSTNSTRLLTTDLIQYESCNNQTADALDAYQRAAELDPNNTHIKARLQLLRSGGGTGPNAQNAPVPQDVHPQAYQTGVGVPPGVQWGMQSAPQPPPQQPPIDPARVTDWTRGIAQIQPPQQGPIQPSYEQRDSMRAPPPRQPSPRQEPARTYQEPSRTTPLRKGHSPSPRLNPAMAPSYPSGPQSLPQINMHDRGPSFGGQGRPQTNGAPAHSPSAPQTNSLPPYGRPFSPTPEIRPLREDPPITPGSAYPQATYHPHQYSSIANGAPPPASALAAAEAAARDRDERPPSVNKRPREWEAEAPSKKAANEETRARLDDASARRTSPQQASMASSAPAPFRRSSSEVRRENERRANENYHPSEAAHHPYTAPGPMPQMPPMQTMLDGPTEDRKEPVENAARKVDVDEDYDNSEDDKKPAAMRNSPQSANAATMPKQEVTA